MKAKTKSQLSRALLYALIFVFVAGTFLLYLPFGGDQPAESQPPVNQPPVDQNAPAVPANTSVPQGR